MSPLLEASRILSPPDQSEVRPLCASILSEASLGVGVLHWTICLEDMTQMLANTTTIQGEEEVRKNQHTLVQLGEGGRGKLALKGWKRSRTPSSQALPVVS